MSRKVSFKIKICRTTQHSTNSFSCWIVQISVMNSIKPIAKTNRHYWVHRGQYNREQRRKMCEWIDDCFCTEFWSWWILDRKQNSTTVRDCKFCIWKCDKMTCRNSKASFKVNWGVSYFFCYRTGYSWCFRIARSVGWYWFFHCVILLFFLGHGSF